VVLRDGVMTAYARRDEIDLDWIVRNMVGKALTSARRRRVTTLVIPRCR
jgi:ABC-type sugar transport system ATPase subunit